MTNNEKELEPLANLIQLSDVGEDNALSQHESYDLAKDVLGRYLIVGKEKLPEAKVMDTMIYSGTQAVSLDASADEVLERALSFLAAASVLHFREAEQRAKKAAEERELIEIINGLVTDPKKKANELSGLTVTEKAAAREIKKLRDRVAKIPLAG